MIEGREAPTVIKVANPHVVSIPIETRRQLMVKSTYLNGKMRRHQRCPAVFGDLIIQELLWKYGGFLKCWYPQIIDFNGIFPCKSCILGYPHDYGNPEIWNHHDSSTFRRSIPPPPCSNLLSAPARPQVLTAGPSRCGRPELGTGFSRENL